MFLFLKWLFGKSCNYQVLHYDLNKCVFSCTPILIIMKLYPALNSLYMEKALTTQELVGEQLVASIAWLSFGRRKVLLVLTAG